MGLNGFPPSPLACALPPHTLSPDPDACARMGWKGCGQRVLDIPSVHPPPQPSTPSSTPTPTSLLPPSMRAQLAHPFISWAYEEIVLQTDTSFLLQVIKGDEGGVRKRKKKEG
jgi:hypothetical protein